MEDKRVFWASLKVVGIEHCSGAGHSVRLITPKGVKYAMQPEEFAEVINSRCLAHGHFTGWFKQQSPIHCIFIAEDSEIPESELN